MEFQSDYPYTHVHVLYAFMINHFMSKDYSVGWCTDVVRAIKSLLRYFKASFWHLFCPNCDDGLNTLMFHLLDHLFDGLGHFGIASVLLSSLYEHVTLFVKHFYSSSSKRFQTRTEDTVR